MTNWMKNICLCLIIVLVILIRRNPIGSNPGPAHKKVIFCYLATYADHRPGKGNFKLEDVNPTLCTHLVYAFVLLNQTDDSVYPLAAWPDLIVDKSEGTNNIVKLKKQYPHLKVTIAIGGWQDGSIKYSIMAANATRRSRFVNSTVGFLKKHGFDGIDLVWSYPGKRGGGRHDKSNFVELVKDLRKAFDPHNYIITAALDSSKDTIDYGYDIAGLSEYLHYMLIWSYDFHGSWSRFIGHNAPLHTDDLLSVEYAINYLLKIGADPQKLVMGIPLCGRPFIAVDPIDTSEKLPGLGKKFKNYTLSGPYTQEDGFLGYNEICLWLQESPTEWTIFWDNSAKVPFAVNGQKFISFDNVKSVREKVKFSKRKGLAGIVVWEIDTDDFRGDCREEVGEPADYPLLRAINKELAADTEDIQNFLEDKDDSRTAAVIGSDSDGLKRNLFVVIGLSLVIIMFFT